MDTQGRKWGKRVELVPQRGWGLELEGLGEVAWWHGRGMDTMTSGQGDPSNSLLPAPKTFLLSLSDDCAPVPP